MLQCLILAAHLLTAAPSPPATIQTFTHKGTAQVIQGEIIDRDVMARRKRLLVKVRDGTRIWLWESEWRITKAPTPEPPELRTWSSATGKYQIQAVFVELVEGKVRLRKEDESVIDVELEKLSEADREYVKKVTAPPPAPPPMPVAGPDVMGVLATGIGEDRDKALKNALTNALEKAVGVLVDAETVVKNDRIIKDQVLTITKGFVNQHHVLSEGKQDDKLYYLNVYALVSRTKLGEELKTQKVVAQIVSGKLLDFELERRLLLMDGAQAMFRRATVDFTPDKFASIEILGEPALGDSSNVNTAVVVVHARMKPKPENFTSIQAGLKPLLDVVVLKRARAVCTSGNWSVSPSMGRTTDEIFLYLGKGSTPEGSTVYFDGYLLPGWLLPEVQALSARHKAYRIRTVLLDAEERVIGETSRRFTDLVVFTPAWGNGETSCLTPMLYRGTGFSSHVDFTETITLDRAKLAQVAKCKSFVELSPAE